MPQTTHADVTGNVCKILVIPGDVVDVDDPLLVLESMTIEIPVVAGTAGVVVAVHVNEGDTVGAGQPLVDLSTE